MSRRVNHCFQYRFEVAVIEVAVIEIAVIEISYLDGNVHNPHILSSGAISLSLLVP